MSEKNQKSKSTGTGPSPLAEVKVRRGGRKAPPRTPRPEIKIVPQGRTSSSRNGR